jgi:regulation of enolase protein 1 (concanavalin A-like superfamily)
MACLIAACASGLPAAHAQAPRQEPPPILDGWGIVTDPAGDCALKADNGKLTMTIPGGTHDLSPDSGGMSAPRVLREVDGDFSARVRVTGAFMPGPRAHNPKTVSFNSAGLLVWHDDKNFVRFERRNWWLAREGKFASPPALPEYFKGGRSQQWQDPTRPELFKGRSTWLEVERRGDKLITSLSHDGREWVAGTQIDVDLPRRVRVGVLAINTSADPFVAEFEGFKVGTTTTRARPAEELKAAPAAGGNPDSRRLLIGMLGMYLSPLVMFFMCAVAMLVCLLTRSTRAWFRLAAQARREHRDMLRSLSD